MSISVLASSPGKTNLTGDISRSRLVEYHRFVKEHFANCECDLYSERSFIDDSKNHIELSIGYDGNIDNGLALMKMVYG